MKTILALAVSLVCAGTLAAQEAVPAPAAETPKKSADGATHVDATAAATLLAEKDEAKKLTVLDIRTAGEFEEAHIDGATNIDFIDPTFEEQITKLDRDKPYLVHCQSGGRSGRSLEVFKKLGFKNIYHLDGGLTGWRTAGNAVVETEKKEEPQGEDASETKDDAKEAE